MVEVIAGNNGKIGINKKDGHGISWLSEKEAQGEFIFDEDIKTIHPAQSFVDGIALTCQFIPHLSYEVNKKTGQGVEIFEELPAIITSEKSIHTLTKKTTSLTINGKTHFIYQAPLKPAKGWSKKSIHLFLGNFNNSISLKEIYDKLTTELKKYIELFQPRYYPVIVLWVMGTYFHQLFNTFPYIFLNATKASGKTKLLTFVSCTAFNAELGLSPTGPTLFRTVSAGRSTMLFDETEKFAAGEITDLRALLLSGYKKGTTVPRTVEGKRRGEDRSILRYDVFGPKMMANINGIDDVLEDRCITIIMRRGRNPEITGREVNIDSNVWQDLRDYLFLSMMNDWKEIKKNYDSLETKALHSREKELWKPLLAIAKTISVELFQEVMGTALMEIEQRRALNLSAEEDQLLMEVLLEYVTSDGWYLIKLLTNEYRARTEDDEAIINNRLISNKLRALGFIKRRRIKDGIEVYLTRDDIEDVASRHNVSSEKMWGALSK